MNSNNPQDIIGASEIVSLMRQMNPRDRRKLLRFARALAAYRMADRRQKQTTRKTTIESINLSGIPDSASKIGLV